MGEGVKKSKQAMFESLLIPVKTRLPQYQPGQVLLKLENGEYSVSGIKDFLDLQNRLKADFYKDYKPHKYPCTKYFATHWMKLY
jgi:hypothetical protein